MALLNIIHEGDDVLRKKCRPVEKITPRILTLLDDMKETLKKAEGAGLAAPQVGVLRRMAVVDNGEKYLELINPEIIASEGEVEDAEACLSCPGKYGYVKRPKKVTVRATDREGKIFTVEGIDIVARCFCHEIDHLDGILFIDRADEVLDEEEFLKR